MSLPIESNVVAAQTLETEVFQAKPEVKPEAKPPVLSLLEQRLALRRQLEDQREIIAFRLTPGNKLRLTGSDQSASYPRSLTMRLLTKNPAPVIKLAIGVATWLIGSRLSGVLHEGVRFIKMLRSEATLR